MKTGRMRPSTVVNLKRIPGLSGVEDDRGRHPDRRSHEGARRRGFTARSAASSCARTSGLDSGLSPGARPGHHRRQRRACLSGIRSRTGSHRSSMPVPPSRCRAASRDELVEDLYVGPGRNVTRSVRHHHLVHPAPTAARLRVGTCEARQTRQRDRHCARRSIGKCRHRRAAARSSTAGSPWPRSAQPHSEPRAQSRSFALSCRPRRCWPRPLSRRVERPSRSAT